MKPIWILNDLFVLEEARRRGIGEQLITAATDHARQTGAIRLELSTAIDNLKAQALYHRLGWKRETAFYHYEFEVVRNISKAQT
jgi:ribosomal protein S18 acetylase RimI-like enzyme